MNPIEDRLSRGLRDQAERIDVDPGRLRLDLEQRLDVPQRRTVRPALAAAAAVILVGGVGVALGVAGPFSGEDELPPAGGDPAPGDVDRSFSCPSTVSVDVSGAQDEFVPDLIGSTPAAVAREYDAPRWDFEASGETAMLWLGNRDRTLGSISTYSRSEDGWVLEAAEACGDGTPDAVTEESLRLGLHDTNPWPPKRVLSPARGPAEPVFVDDRAIYDYSGLVTRHRSIYVQPCGDRLCWAAGQPDGGITDRLKPTGEYDDVTDVFFLPDDMVGREPPFAVYAAWDPDGTAAEPDTDTLPRKMASGAEYRDESWGAGVLRMAIVLPTD